MVTRFELKWKMSVRAAGLIVDAANKYTSTFALLSSSGAWVNGRKIFEWRFLDLKVGSRVTLMIEGADAAAARREMAEIFSAVKKPARAPRKTL